MIRALPTEAGPSATPFVAIRSNPGPRTLVRSPRPIRPQVIGGDRGRVSGGRWERRWYQKPECCHLWAAHGSRRWWRGRRAAFANCARARGAQFLHRATVLIVKQWSSVDRGSTARRAWRKRSPTARARSGRPWPSGDRFVLVRLEMGLARQESRCHKVTRAHSCGSGERARRSAG